MNRRPLLDAVVGFILGILFALPPASFAQNLDTFDHVDPLAPLPITPNASTARQLREERLAYNRRTLADAYREHGSRDDAWDAQVFELLEEVAKHFSSYGNYLPRRELIDSAKTLLDGGCDDPLVQYCYAALLQDEDESNETQQRTFLLLKACYGELVERGYPANRRLSAARRLWKWQRQCSHGSEAAHAAWLVMVSELLDVIELDDVSSTEGRNLVPLFDEVLDVMSTKQKEAFYNQAKAFEAEQPFLVNYIGGAWHYDAAWKSRGHGWAADVTEEGWRGFGEHMAEARWCYEAAYDAAPDRPEAAAKMVNIASGSSDSPLREMRFWLDRAVEAQIDYLPVYHNLMYGMAPRWHGSFGMLYAFGLECKNSERYDTDVPYLFCDALWKIANDGQNPLGLRALARAGIYEEVEDLCGRYIDRAQDPYAIRWWRSLQLGFAYSAGRMDEATVLLDKIDENVVYDVFSHFPLNRDQVITDIRLHASPKSKAIREALATESGDAGSPVDKLEQLTELAGDEELHPLLRRLVASRLQTLRWQASYAKGETVDLSVEDNSLYGWRSVAGDWVAEHQGGILGVAGVNGVIARCEVEVGPRWELTCECRFGRSRHAWWDTGVILYSDGQPFSAVMYNPSKKTIAVGPYRGIRSHRKPINRVARQPVSLKVRFDDGVVDVWLDDDQVVQQMTLPSWRDGAPIQIGVGANYNATSAGQELIFRKPTVRKLK